MSYTKGSMLGGFFDGIGQQDSAEALTEAIIEHVDNAVFRDMYMDTIDEALDNGVDYLENYDEEGMAIKEGIDDALFDLGTDFDDIPEPSYTSEAYEPEFEYAAEACDEAIQNCIRKLPDGDPADAGTYFSLVNRVNAEDDPEAKAAIKEQLDMVSVYIPDTDIVTEDGTAPVTNGLRFSNGRDKCPEQYNKPTQSFVNKDGNELVQAEELEEAMTDIMDLEDIVQEMDQSIDNKNQESFDGNKNPFDGKDPSGSGSTASNSFSQTKKALMDSKLANNNNNMIK